MKDFQDGLLHLTSPDEPHYHKQQNTSSLCVLTLIVRRTREDLLNSRNNQQSTVSVFGLSVFSNFIINIHMKSRSGAG
jgi:predicted component of type VI protein secretion system